MTADNQYTDSDSIPQENTSTRAPSEKHLENWIGDNFFRFGELVELDLVPEYARENLHIQDDVYYVAPFFEDIIRRQPSFVNGIPDYIMRTNTSVSVVELKKGSITFDVIGQCLRYMYDMREMFYWTFMDALSTDNPDRESYSYEAGHRLEYTEYPDSEITGMVVGHSFSDKNIPLVAAASHIAVVTYKFDGTNYTFERHGIESKARSVDDYQRYIDTSIGRAIRLLMQNRKTRQQGKTGNDE